MNDIQKQLVEISRTPEMYRKMETIGAKYDLFLDVQDELSAEIQNVIRGYRPAKDFVKNIQNTLEINSVTANKIAADVNSEIFIPLREKMQELQSQSAKTPSGNAGFVTPQTTPTVPPLRTPTINPFKPVTPPAPVHSIPTTVQTPIPPTNSNLPPMVSPQPGYVKPTFEQAGRFTIEKPPVGMPQYKKEPEINKENVLLGIEDPALTMVDHLLSTPVNTAQAVEIKKPLVPKPVVDNKPYTSDPYREEI